MTDDLAENRRDHAVLVLKGALGAIPYVGGVAAEVIGTLIPNQRQDRIVRVVQALSDKVEELTKEHVKSRFIEPGFVDLFEDGLWAASRATAEERIQFIASLLKNALSAEDAKAIEYKKLLSLLNQLNNIEILILRGEMNHASGDEAFREKYGDVIAPKSADADMDQDELDDATLHGSYHEQLYRLGLMQRIYGSTSGKAPEYDPRLGQFKAHGRSVTPLGRLVLRAVDLISADDV